MYKTVELNEYLDESDKSIAARIGEDEGDITLTIECQEIIVSKKDLLTIRRWLNAVIREAT